MKLREQRRIGAGFATVWVLLGCGWLYDYFFGGTELKQLFFGELTVLLGIGAGTAMVREGNRRRKAATDAGKDAANGNSATGVTGNGHTELENPTTGDAESEKPTPRTTEPRNTAIENAGSGGRL